MTTLPVSAASISPLRQRLINNMSMRRFSAETQRKYIRDIGRQASFLGRSPDTASVEDLRRFQIAQQEAGHGVPTMNAIVSALRIGRVPLDKMKRGASRISPGNATAEGQVSVSKPRLLESGGMMSSILLSAAAIV